MPNDIPADYLVDRRLLRRKLSFWRGAAFVTLAIALVIAGFRIAAPGGASSFSAQIARVTISGLITGDRGTLTLLRDVGRSRAAAVILTINSPGGTTTGSEREYQAIRDLAAKKPVVAVVDDVAASGAYIAALGADHIVASGNSLVGSIGVLFQFPNFSKLLDTVGVQMEEVKSAPLKAAPNGFEPTSPDARAGLASLVADSYVWFKGLVQERRHLSDAELAAVSDGRVFTGRQGLPLKLVDALGGQREAIAWLENEKGVAKNLPVRDWTQPRGFTGLGLLGLSSNIVGFLGFDSLADLLRRADQTRQTQSLDGLVSIWQVGSPN